VTRKIIDMEDGFEVSISTFWKGTEEGVQITDKKRYVQLSRREAIRVFEIALQKLRDQEREDRVHPPWWQTISRKGNGQGEKKCP